MDALRALIQAYDDGSMGVAQIEILDAKLPGWRDDDARVALRLAQDWTDEQIAEYLCPRIAANNDEILHPSIAQILSNQVPDTRTLELAGQA